MNILEAATSGLVADARALVERARVEAQINKITYSEPIRVDSLSKKLCDMLQMYTQNGGVRPFGSALTLVEYMTVAANYLKRTLVEH